MSRRRTILVGCGNIGATYTDDPVMARHFRYATHAQVLADHPAFEWCGAIDVNPALASRVAAKWGVAGLTRVEELPYPNAVEVAVLAVPPGERLPIIQKLPNLKALVVEKPLGMELKEAEDFVSTCASRNIVVQVNLSRRCDSTHKSLAEGELERRIGRPQGATIVYGNGLLNNGTHMVDLVRMLLGEVVAVDSAAGSAARREGPIEGDINVAFAMRLASGIPVLGLPVGFAHYREISLDIWGEQGRLAITQEGLSMLTWKRTDHRSMHHQQEIPFDEPIVETTTLGEAQRAVYDDLAAALDSRRTPTSSAYSALITARTVDAIRRAAIAGRRLTVSP